jgi:hypothetical protein
VDDCSDNADWGPVRHEQVKSGTIVPVEGDDDAEAICSMSELKDEQVQETDGEDMTETCEHRQDGAGGV